MNNSENLPQQQDNSFQTSKENILRTSIAVAFERTGTEVNNIDNMVLDVFSEFPNVNIEQILIALRNGSLGKYGKTYKFTTQEICIWIRKYLEETVPKIVYASHPIIFD
jgi:hypothetical protein